MNLSKVSTGLAMKCFSRGNSGPANPGKLEKAGTVDFKEHPKRKVGTRSRQCRPKVPSRFAFSGARNRRICGTSQFKKNFPAILTGLSQSFPREPRTDRGNIHSLLEFSKKTCKNKEKSVLAKPFLHFAKTTVLFESEILGCF